MKYYNNFRNLEDDEEDEDDFDDPGDIPPLDNREPQPPFPILYDIYPTVEIQSEIMALRPYTLVFSSIDIDIPPPFSSDEGKRGVATLFSTPNSSHKNDKFVITGITPPLPFGWREGGCLSPTSYLLLGDVR